LKRAEVAREEQSQSGDLGSTAFWSARTSLVWPRPCWSALWPACWPWPARPKTAKRAAAAG